MHTTTNVRERDRLRPLLVIIAAAALLLALAGLVGPVRAATTVQLGSQFIGADSSTFQEDSSDCGSFGTSGSGVVWHFILNQLDAGTAGGTLTASFDSAGSETATGNPVGNGSTQHYFILTPTDDILDGASAVVEDQTGTPSLVLSHVCHQSGGATPTPTPEITPTPTPEVTPTPTPEITPTPTPGVTPTPVVTPTPTPTQSTSAATPTPTPTQSPEGSVLSATGTPEGQVQGATGTPVGSLANTSIDSGRGGDPLPTVLFSLIVLLSLGGLAYTNVSSARRRG